MLWVKAEDVKARNVAAWEKWHDLRVVLCDLHKKNPHQT